MTSSLLTASTTSYISYSGVNTVTKLYLKRLSKSSSIELALNIHFDVFLLLQMVWDNFQYISLNGKEDQIINALISYIG